MYMKKIIIAPPFSNGYQSLPSFIFSELSIFSFSIACLYVGLFPYEPFQEQIFLVLFGIALFIFGIWAIFIRAKVGKNLTVINDSGFTFKNGRQNISWDDIEYIFMTFAFKKEPVGEEVYTGYPFLFLKLKGGYVHTDQNNKVGKYEYPYIVNDQYFKDYMGKGKDFTIAINTESMSEKDSEILITKLPIKVEPVRPIMEVKTKEEYNKKIYELVDPEKQKDYLLE